MQNHQPSRIALLVALLIASTAIVGYFVGLQSPMNPAEKMAKVQRSNRGARAALSLENLEPGAISSTHYSDMAEAVIAHAPSPGRSLVDGSSFAVDVPNSPLDPGVDQLTAERKITLEDKRFALAMRKRNRAFNGAPPTVPHPISEISAESCSACHGQGTQTATLRIPKMSHPFLSNCTQCHVGTASADLPHTRVTENHFAGLAAPEGGPTAFAGAPPQIPHPTWMRDDCNSCHGPSSYRGLQTTHPWRQNCQQCHAPSSALEQNQLDRGSKFLPPIPVDPL